MKAHARIAVLLFLAAAFCLPQFSTKLNAQTGGMADFQNHSIRGEVTAVSGSTITVKTEEGEVYTVSTGPNTHFRKQRDQIAIGDVHSGDMIVAFGDKDPKAHTIGAAFVMVIDKGRYEQMRADFGKTWTGGKVQSINGTNITIKRPDNVIQTIAVDENTSFRRRREDIVLPDIKPGDNISARGALHNGAFLATEVNVGRGGFGAGPGYGQGRHRSSQSDSPSQNN